MSTQFLFPDIGLTFPIVIFPLGDISDKGKQISSIFQNFPMKCIIEPSENQELKQLCKTKKVFLPYEISAQVFVLNSESEYLIARNRFQLESSMPFLNWFLTLNFIEGMINDDFANLQKRAKELSLSTFECNFFILKSKNQNENLNLSSFKSENTFVYTLDDELSTHSIIKDIQSQFVQFICPLIMQSLKRNISTIVNFDITKPIKRRISFTSQGISIIQRSALGFLSTNILDKVHAFSDSLKTLETIKPVEYQKYGALFEMLGLVEEEIPGTIKKSQLPDRILNCSPYWIFEEKNDAIVSYSVAATLYWNANLPSKTLDCGFHILNYFSKFRIGGRYPLFMINECQSLIASLSGEELMESRAFELIVLAFRLGLLRRIPLLSYQLSQNFKNNIQVDFLFLSLNFLYTQSQKQEGDLFILQLATPIVDTLLTSDIYPIEKCRLIFRLLSTIGPSLSRNSQEHLFMRLIGITIGDLRIPCNLGLKSQAASIIKPSFEIIPIQPKVDHKQKSIFLYNALNSTTETNSKTITVGVGSQFRIQFSLYNPFALDLPIIVSGTNISKCISEDYPLPLKGRSNNTLFCCLIPTEEGEIVVDSIDCILYQGLQHVSLPSKLTVKAVNGIGNFSVRSELPLKQTIELYDGEIYAVKLWITNTGDIPITKLKLKFPMKSIESTYNKNEISQILEPRDVALVNLSFQIKIPADEIAIGIFAQTDSNKSMQMVQHIRQPISIKKAVCITGISALKYIPEVNMDISRLVFVSIDVTNHTNRTLQYKVSFTPALKERNSIPLPPTKSNEANSTETNQTKNNSTETYESKNDNSNEKINDDNTIKSSSQKESNENDTSLAELPGIISTKEVSGVLIGDETTSLIIAIPKSILLNPPIHAPPQRKIQAARNAQITERHFTEKSRAKLDLRVDAAAFIEKFLNFTWFYGATRRGSLMNDNALPSKELMKEVRMQRPCITCSFHYFDDIARYLNSSENEARCSSNSNLIGNKSFSYLVALENSKSLSTFGIRQNADENTTTTESIQSSSSHNTFDVNNGVLHSLDDLSVRKNVLLSIDFGNVRIKRCRLDLGIYSDSYYGIMWNRLLDQTAKEWHLNSPSCTNRFDFVLYFNNKGTFHFKIFYETVDSVKGNFPVDVNVVHP